MTDPRRGLLGKVRWSTPLQDSQRRANLVLGTLEAAFGKRFR